MSFAAAKISGVLPALVCHAEQQITASKQENTTDSEQCAPPPHLSLCLYSCVSLLRHPAIRSKQVLAEDYTERTQTDNNANS